MLQFHEFKLKIAALEPGLIDLGQALKLDDARRELEQLEADSAVPGFWDDLKHSQKVLQQIKQLRQKCETYDKLHARWQDLGALCEMAIEENDESLLPELKGEFEAVDGTIEQLRLSTLLSGEYDSQNAILSLNAGAGGTEAQDWAQMLYRMYTRWAERHG
ncbi:MAG: PCRF domain-containing protein, partial [Oscillospiraceae bacterium]|nr:PCRF domain-containing protein [Oscillospiraceae bacterium]